MSRRKSSAQYVKLVLIAACFDCSFAIEELITQHQLHVKGGVIYILAHGIEQFVPEKFYWLCLIPHGFFTVHGLFILSGLYHFRYTMMINVNTSTWILARNICITSTCALVTACSLAYGVTQGEKLRGYSYYYKKLENEWFGKYGQNYFVYAADLTVNAFVFAFFPVGLFTFLALFRLNGEYLGILVMAVVSWLPAANGAITIYVVKDFRNFVKNFVGCRRIKVMSATVSVIGSSTMPKYSRTTRNLTSQTAEKVPPN
ncbi:unnamed protein product [Bursaphelenchus okinawaensis]|uniref:7TM_GPCR_Srx domain-containing protein n=1 Tax=Bursaphelenchus okinawaensis TaxID=465554 RepID=A0A811KC21_9BILA|nr:unnamed protein product [Bursaphelenchus okinawaensis]CAG9100640.1 unnamed protein product [Bursaphelenchus okinawaensis]